MAIKLKALFGKNSAAYQLFVWQIAGQIVQTLLGPAMEELAQQINGTFPIVELSPSDLARLVARSWMSEREGADEASHSGVNADRFAKMVKLSTGSPSIGDLATALRRGIIPADGSGQDSTSFAQGLREAGLNGKWVNTVKELSVQWPTPNDALDALLEGQISEADGKALYAKFGGDPEYFQMLYDTRGNAPTPNEALVLANRGIIPWTGRGPNVVSYEQAFLEGPWRNKWQESFKSLGEYLPPPRTVTAMVGNGSLSRDQGLELLRKQGLSPDLAAAYVNDALHSQNSTDKQLTVSQLLDLYSAQLISANDVKPLLSALNYSDESIDWLLAYRDLQRAMSATRSAVSRVHTLYVGHKISRDETRNVLAALNVPADQVGDILNIWDIERTSNLKALTPAEIGNAWKYEIIDMSEALSELQALGYTARDAWIYLSVVNKAPLDMTSPEQGPSGTTATT